MKKVIEQLPSLWIENPLKEHSSFLRRGKSPEYCENNQGLFVINQDCIRWNSIDLSKVKFHVFPSRIDESFFLRPGDILINSTGTGTIGRVNQWLYPDIKAIADSHVTVLRVTEESIDTKYARYFFASELGQRYLESVCYTGSTNQIELSKRYLSKMRLPCAPLEEQKAIAKILSKVDEAIEAVEKSIEAAEQLKKPLMQNLLTGKLKPDGSWRSEDEFFVDEKFGKIPKKWKKIRIGNIYNILSGKGFAFDEYTDKGVRLVKIDNVGWSEILWNNITYLPENYIEKYSHLVLEEDDIIMALNRPITQDKLKIALITKKDIPSILYQRVGKFLFDSESTDKRFSYYFLSVFLYNFIRKMSVGSDQPFINVSTLRKQHAYIPEGIEEQQNIGNNLIEIDSVVTSKRTKIQSLRKLKKSLMQNLLTGTVRVDAKIINKLLEEV